MAPAQKDDTAKNAVNQINEFTGLLNSWKATIGFETGVAKAWLAPQTSRIMKNADLETPPPYKFLQVLASPQEPVVNVSAKMIDGVCTLGKESVLPTLLSQSTSSQDKLKQLNQAIAQHNNGISDQALKITPLNERGQSNFMQAQEIVTPLLPAQAPHANEICDAAAKNVKAQKSKGR